MRASQELAIITATYLSAGVLAVCGVSQTTEARATCAEVEAQINCKRNLVWVERILVGGALVSFSGAGLGAIRALNQWDKESPV